MQWEDIDPQCCCACLVTPSHTHTHTGDQPFTPLLLPPNHHHHHHHHHPPVPSPPLLTFVAVRYARLPLAPWLSISAPAASPASVFHGHIEQINGALPGGRGFCQSQLRRREKIERKNSNSRKCKKPSKLIKQSRKKWKKKTKKWQADGKCLLFFFFWFSENSVNRKEPPVTGA